jgi:hypothetical protein
MALLALPPAIAGEPRPDFSGRWTAQPEAKPPTTTLDGVLDEPPGDPGSGWGNDLTIGQSADRLTLDYVFFGPMDMQPPLRFVFALDGTETQNTVMMGRGLDVQTSRAVWDGGTLVITTTHRFTDPGTGEPMTCEVARRLSLGPPGSLVLVVETTRSGVLGGSASTSRTVYRRVDAGPGGR